MDVNTANPENHHSNRNMNTVNLDNENVNVNINMDEIPTDAIIGSADDSASVSEKGNGCSSEKVK